MSLLSRLKGTGPSGFGYGSTAAEVVAGIDLNKKTYLLTGCNSGLGKETMRVLAERGAHIIGAARTLAKASDAGVEADAELTPVACDLSEPADVRAAVETIKEGPKLDGIICNAGIMALPKLTTKHGLELQFLTNHVGHFILVTGLLEHLTATGRVVVVSSNAHMKGHPVGIQFDNLDGARGYQSWAAYAQSKLANLLFARELATRLPDGQVANALHPGVIHTNLARNMNPLVDVVLTAAAPVLLKSVPEGAATQVWAAAHPDAARITGEYLANCNIAKSNAHGRDMALARKLWDRSEEIVAELGC